MTTGTRILVVEEDHATRELVSDLLTDDGHQVTQVHWADDALEIFRKAPFPIVITEIAMRCMSGIGLLQKIKELSPETEVILLTSYASIDTAVAALRCGAYDYLIKPIEGLSLISSVVNRTLEKTRLVAENRRLLERLKAENEELRTLNERLKRTDLLDEATGLNREGYFQRALEMEVERCREHGRTFSLILLQGGPDAAPCEPPQAPGLSRRLALRIKRGLWRSDLLTHWGAGGFALLLPETPRDGAVLVAEKISAGLEKMRTPEPEGPQRSAGHLGVGLATFPEDGDDGASLLRRACQPLRPDGEPKAS